MSARDLTAGKAADYVLPPACGTAGQVMVAPSGLTSGRKQLEWATPSGPGGFAQVGTVALTFEESGGDGSTTSVTGEVYQDGPLYMYVCSSISGSGVHFQVAGGGFLVTTAFAPLSAFAPTTAMAGFVSLVNTSTGAVSGAQAVVSSAGAITINPLTGAPFPTTNPLYLRQFALTWIGAPPATGVTGPDELLADAEEPSDDDMYSFARS